MNPRILYLVAGVLALTAAAIYQFRAAPGEDVLMRVGLLAVLGVVMIVLGLRRTGAGPG